MNISKTKNYDRFDLHEINRPVKNTKKLELSMIEHGFIDAHPLHVITNGNGKLKIKDGHHRFMVARKLGIPVKYVVCDDAAGIHQLVETTNKWSLRDYLSSYEQDRAPPTALHFHTSFLQIHQTLHRQTDLLCH